LPLLLPSEGASSVLSSSDGLGSLPSSLIASRPLITTGQQLLDSLAPKLTREEELYAISLVDLARSSFGEQTADLVAGNLAQEPRAAARAAIPLLEALIDAAGPGDAASGQSGRAGSPALLQLAQGTVTLLKRLPGVEETGSSPAHTDELGAAMGGLDTERREVLREALGDMGSALAAKLDERLVALT